MPVFGKNRRKSHEHDVTKLGISKKFPTDFKKNRQDVRNSLLGKVTKFRLDISKRLAMTYEKREGGGGFSSPPPRQE